MSDNDLTITISGDAKKFGAAVDEAKGKVDGLESAFKIAEGVFGGEAMLEGAKKIGEVLGDLFQETLGEGVKAAEADEEAFQRLNFALAANGNYSKESSEAMHELAEQIGSTTRFSAEAALQSEALLEAMTGMTEGGIKKTMKASADLAAAFNLDLGTATRDLSMAFNGNATMLKRTGLAFDQGATSAETFNNAMAAIGRLSGAAQASLDTYVGSLDHMHNTWEEATKTLGVAIVDNVALRDAFNEISVIIQQLTGYLKTHEQEMKEFVGGGVLVAISAIQGLVEMMNILYRTSQITLTPMKLEFEIVKGIIEAVIDVIHGRFQAALADVTKTAKTMGGTVKTSFSNLTQGSTLLNQLDASLEKVGNAAEKGFAQIVVGADKSEKAYRNGSKAVKDLTQDLTDLEKEGVKLAKSAAELDPRKKYEDEMAALNAAHAKMAISDSQYTQAKLNLKDAELKKIDTLEKAAFDKHLARLKALALDDAHGNADKIADEQKTLNLMLTMEDENGEARGANAKKLAEYEKQINKEKLDTISTVAGNFATLQKSQNSELAAVGKAAAIAQTTVQTYAGATAAMASAATIPFFGWSLGPIIAASYITAGLANVANIAGVAFADGGMMSGGIPGTDSIPGMYMPGELVVPEKNFEEVVGSVQQSRSNTQAAAPPPQHVYGKIELSMKGNLVDMVEAKIIEKQNLNIAFGKSL